MRVLLFDGQGATQASSSSSVTTTCLRPLAALFVQQAHDTLRACLAAVSPETERALNTGATRPLLAHLRNGRITLPTSDATLLRNPIVSLPSVYVAQVVRLFELLEAGVEWDCSRIDVVGYSSGLLPALLVATSLPAPSEITSPLSLSTQLTLLRNALALFEVSVILGVETQVSKLAMLNEIGITLDDPYSDREWSAVLFNEAREILEAKIAAWNSEAKDVLHRIHLTAQTTTTCHSISGPPSILQAFIHRELPEASQSLPSGSTRAFSRTSSIDSLRASARNAGQRGKSLISSEKTSRTPLVAPKPLHSQIAAALRASASTPLPTSPSPSLASFPIIKPLEIFTLFHANVRPLVAARDRIISELFPRRHCVNSRETFAVLDSLQLSPNYSLYDTQSGRVITSRISGRSLVEHVLNLILLDSVEFSTLVKSTAGRTVGGEEVELINFGPGTGLVRVTMRALKEQNPSTFCSWVDASTPSVPPIPEPSRSYNGESIAIVGMASNFPGARNNAELWRILEEGINTVEEIPKSRFSVSSYLDTNPDAKPNRKMKTRFGNFLADGVFDGFDNTFFRISPKEARALDPQMRLLMRVGFQAAEAAGLIVDTDNNDPRTSTACSTLRGEDVGCFVGVATSDYALNLKNDVGVHYATGTLPAFLAGRLAYALNLSGPSVVTNTACSSSVVAIHQACRAILAGDCKAALAGGVNVISSPDMYLGLDRGHFLSPSGNCKPWDASADGYCRAEGCGMFVFKRLSDALASSDNILGIIRATEINQSAAAVSITRPHAPTQATLIRRLLDKTGIRPEDINLVEAHGTGTQAGDPEELKSLRAILSPNNGNNRNIDNMLTVTSVKANIGHAEAASGAASLAKVLLMFQHRKVPAQIGLINLNPKIEPLENDFTRINLSGKPIDWTTNADGTRIALVNNFGAAGSNAAMLVEQPPSRAAVATKDANDQVLFAFSADNETALLRLRDSYLSFVTDANFVDVAYTATARRKLRAWRMAVSADSPSDLVRKLSEARPVLVPTSRADTKKTIFVFSGQGGQHLGMGRQLYHTSRAFRRVIDTCHELLVGWGYPGILAIIDSEGKTSGLQETDELIAYQCAIFSLECALCDLWESWGVKADVVVGHSLGEYAALVAAGVLTIETGLRLVARRVRLMTERCARNEAGMLLVRLAEQAVEQAIASADDFKGITISCNNAPAETVVGGPLSQLRNLKAHLELSGVKCVFVNVPYAYHTSAMDPIVADFAEFARKATFNTPRIPIISNVTGDLVEPDMEFFDGDYLARHCRETVRFEKSMRNLVSTFNSTNVFIELGPHPTTLPMVTQFTIGTENMTLHSLHKKHSAWTSLFSSLSKLFLTQKNILWNNVFRELCPSTQCIEIPGYPLQETSFWIPYVEDTPIAPVQHCQDLKKRFPFLDSWVNRPSSRDGNVSEFETPIEQLAEYIIGHSVASVPLCPASVYSELALSAATCTLQYTQDVFDDVLTLSETQFTHPLLYDPANPVTIRTSINLHPRGGKHAGTFTISSMWNGVEQHIHCNGFFQRREKSSFSTKLQLNAGHVERGKSSLLNPVVDTYHETLRTRTIYDLIFPRVVQYSKLFQVISTMTIDEKNGEAIATVRIPQEQADQSFVAQPVFVDALLHAAGFLINSRALNTDAYICSQVDSTKMLLDIDTSAAYEIYCTTSPCGDGLILADAWAMQVGDSPKIVGHIKRMRFSRVRLTNLQKSLSRTVESFHSNVPSPATQFLKPSGVCSRPVTPAPLGSPFRVAQRAETPSSLSSVTAVNPLSSDPTLDVLKLVAEISGVPLADIKPASNLADLGIDSLLWIELIGQLKQILPEHILDAHDFMSCETAGELVIKMTKRGRQSMFGLKKMGSSASFSTPCLQRRVNELPRAQTPAFTESPYQKNAKTIISKVLEIPVGDLRGDESLDALGLDSLGSIEALHELQEQFSIELPHDFFREYTTLDAVQDYLSNRHESEPTVRPLEECISATPAVIPESSLLPLQTTASREMPLFLVHDGSGLSSCYSRIGGLSRQLFGINNPKLLTGELWNGGIPEMAANYASQIRAIATEKGCILGGWSFGGVVAFHAACQLIRDGINVAGVVLIDSPSPFTKHSLPDAVIKKAINFESENVSMTERQEKIVNLARIQMAHATNALVAYDPLRSSEIANLSTLPNVAMIRCKDAFPTDGLSILPSERLSFLCDRDDPKAIVADWEELTGKSIPVFDIPGHHFEPFKPNNIPFLTQQLRKALAHLEAL